MTSASRRAASALGLSTVDCWSALLAGGLGGMGGGTARCLLRIAMAAAAAAPAASMAVPARTFGKWRDRGLGGSSFRAAMANMAETLGATVSCTETLPRTALTAIHARTLPTLGLAQVAALPAPCLAVIAAFFVIGRAWSASFDACMAIFLARHCMSAAGVAACFLDVTDTDVLPRSNLHREVPPTGAANRGMPRS